MAPDAKCHERHSSHAEQARLPESQASLQSRGSVFCIQGITQQTRTHRVSIIYWARVKPRLCCDLLWNAGFKAAVMLLLATKTMRQAPVL